MAHYAQLDSNNKVTQVIVVANEELLTEDWEREWQKDFVYLLEEQKRAEQEELYGRQPAQVVVI